MTTIAGVIERCYRDFLLPPDEQPTRFKVDTGGINTVSTTLPVSATLLSPEEQDAIAVGNLIEVVSATTGGELMLIEAVTGSPPTSLTVRRNMYDSGAVAHIATDLIYLAPDFPRKTVFEAIADNIEALWPQLWTARTEETYTSPGPVELPESCEEILEVRVFDGNRWALTGGWELLTDYPLFTSGKAIQWLAAGSGEPLHVKYRASTIRPTSEADDLADDLNVEEGWVKAIVVGAVAQVLAKEDIDRATVEFITNALQSEGFGVGAGANLRNSLLQYQEYLLRPLRDGLEARHQTQVVIEQLI